MGDFFQTIVDCEATENQAHQLGLRVTTRLIERKIIRAEKTDSILSDTGLGYPPGPSYHLATTCRDAHLATLLTNGFAVITDRNVFHPGQGGGDAVCSSCSYRFEIGGEAWGNAVDEWFSASGPGLLACPKCKASQAINHWQHDPSWGFGCLGFEFWNWPPLSMAFIQQVSDMLNHKVVLVSGKL